MSTLQQRRKQFIQWSSGSVLLLGVILILLNVVANWVSFRVDLTQNRVYSLTPSSKKLVRSLDDVLLIKAYFTPELPPPYNSYARYVRDMLNEYRAASKGRVRYEFVSPTPVDKFERRAQEAGLQPIQFEELGSNQLQIRRGFMGLVLYYRDRSETLPVVKDIKPLEYDLTSRIARMAKKDKKRIAVLEGHGETNWQTQTLAAALDIPQMFQIQNVPLSPSTTEPINADALLIVGPQKKFEPNELWAIDQAVMRGIPVAFLLDAKRFMQQQFIAMPQQTGLEDLLKNYGLDFRDRLICDAQCATVGMTQNMGGLSFTTSVRYPFVPLITRFEKNHPVPLGIESVALPFCSEVTHGVLPLGVRFTGLMYTSDKSWLAPANTYLVSPSNIPPDKPGEPHGPFTAAAMLEGVFPSYFAGKALPPKGLAVIAKSPPTSIFVLSTSHILDPNLPEFPGSEALVINVLSYLTHDETLLGIRSKGEILRPLKPIGPAARDLAKLISLLGAPLLPVAWGLLRWRRREAWRRAIAAQFGAVPAKA